MSKLGSTVLDFVGNTPVMRLNVIHEGQVYSIYAKLEFMNPSGSVKDRIAKYMLESAEQRGILKPDSIIVEATSGNTGIALSMAAAAKRYKIVVFMPEHMTQERIRLMESLGAEVCLTPKTEGFQGAIRKTEVIAAKSPNVYLTRQFSNEDNIMAHYSTTGQEIREQVKTKIDAFVAGVGTGGTLMGVGRALREINRKTKLVAVEPGICRAVGGICFKRP